jgi:hypothetical protein
MEVWVSLAHYNFHRKGCMLFFKHSGVDKKHCGLIISISDLYMI